MKYWIDGGWGVDVRDDGTAKQANLQGSFYAFGADLFGSAVFAGRTLPHISIKGQRLFHTG